MERGTGFEPAHPRVEASVHSLFYVTPAKYARTLYGKDCLCQRQCAHFSTIKLLSRRCLRSGEVEIHSGYGSRYDYRRNYPTGNKHPLRKHQARASENHELGTAKSEDFNATPSLPSPGSLPGNDREKTDSRRFSHNQTLPETGSPVAIWSVGYIASHKILGLSGDVRILSDI